MILTPAIGWSRSRRIRAASAGGQDEHPSEVNNSTSTGTRVVSAAPAMPARNTTTATRSAVQAARLAHRGGPPSETMATELRTHSSTERRARRYTAPPVLDRGVADSRRAFAGAYSPSYPASERAYHARSASNAPSPPSGDEASTAGERKTRPHLARQGQPVNGEELHPRYASETPASGWSRRRSRTCSPRSCRRR